MKRFVEWISEGTNGEKTFFDFMDKSESDALFFSGVDKGETSAIQGSLMNISYSVDTGGKDGECEVQFHILKNKNIKGTPKEIWKKLNKLFPNMKNIEIFDTD